MVAGNDDDDSGQGLGRWSKISTTTAEPRDLEVVQNFDDDDDDDDGWSTRGLVVVVAVEILDHLQVSGSTVVVVILDHLPSP